MLQIQATFIGYAGRPCTLFAGYDPQTRILSLAAETDFRRERRAGCVVLTNDPDTPRDGWFDERGDLGRAIAAYYQLKLGMADDGKSTRLVFNERAQRANPEQAIERDGIDPTGGAKYRVADGATCGQMASLAVCLYVIKADTVERTVAMADRLKVLTSGGILTI